MTEQSPAEHDFLRQITAVVDKNISDEQFGVSELAHEMNMSRSNLLRKVKKLTQLSVSQLISQIRLKRGMELLRKSSLNVSEVSHQVGFNSTSYFIKCFREFYGFPPGEVGKREAGEVIPVQPVQSPSKRKFVIAGAVGLAIVLVMGWFVYEALLIKDPVIEKSIVVLPFKNDSNDSTNVYLINGLMESTLNNLQQIKDLKVISRTSAEKYRNTAKSIPEMARELNANYFVEGSGQKIGDRIVLNIQLIEGATDKHLWARQYRRESKDIFELQQEIARNISDEIKAIITPEEEQRIRKTPTRDLEAYDLFLKGNDLMHGKHVDMAAAIPYFKKAIEKDHEFALAYAVATIAYFYLDMFQAEKQYVFEINSYAEKAFLYDSTSAECLFAKALVSMHRKEYHQAVPFLEKALEYNPNSVLVINFLSDLYNNYIPNTAKYLEYALLGLRLDAASHDSIATSYHYLRLSDALIQAGFVEESLMYVNKSLAYNPDNFYSRWVKVFILYARDKDPDKARDRLAAELARDTSQLVMVEEMAKVCYMMRDYKGAYQHYQKFIRMREARQLNIFQHEDLKIAIVLDRMGKKEEAKKYAASFKILADNEKTIYKHALLAGYYAYKGDAARAVEHMSTFSKEDNFKYWMLLFDDDPVADLIKDLPEFKKAMNEIETKFWANHKAIRATLETKGLL